MALLTPNIHTFKVKVILSVAPEAAVASAYEMTAAPFTLVRQSKIFPETADVNSETTDVVMFLVALFLLGKKKKKTGTFTVLDRM